MPVHPHVHKRPAGSARPQPLPTRTPRSSEAPKRNLYVEVRQEFRDANQARRWG